MKRIVKPAHILLSFETSKVLEVRTNRLVDALSLLGFRVKPTQICALSKERFILNEETGVLTVSRKIGPLIRDKLTVPPGKWHWNN